MAETDRATSAVALRHPSVNLRICIPRSCHWYKDSSPVERCPTAAKRTPTGDRPPAGSAHLQRRDSQRSGREWTVASDNRPASRTQAEADQRSKRRISADAHPGRPFRRPRAASSRHAGVPAIVPPGPAAGTCVESVISRHSPHGGPRAQAPRAITPPRPGPFRTRGHPPLHPAQALLTIRIPPIT